MERLQKFLSRAGVASRRHAEELIVEGRVKVNGKVVTVLGTQVDAQKDLVLLDNKLVSVNPDRKYFLFYKPPGVVTTLSDPEGRPSVGDYAQETGGRVFPVGRLDYDAEGALLLTDDGELANKLMHPSHQVPRVYLAKVKGTPDDASLQKLVDGVRLEDGMAQALQARIFDKAQRNTWVKIVVTEGRQHLVKRLCAAIGHPVVRLYRPAHAGLSVHGLRPGELRALTNDEIRRVKAAADGDQQPEPSLYLPARRHGHGAPGFEPDEEDGDTRPEGKRHEGGAEERAEPRRESKPREDERPRLAERQERPRSAGSDRSERGSRPRSGGDERPESGGRERPERPRFGAADRKERPRFGGERPDRPRAAGGDREERPRFGGGDRQERPRFGGDRNDRPRAAGGDRSEREERPRFGGDRNDRPRAARGERSEREERPRFGGGRGDRQERPRFGGDRKDREERPRSGGGESRPRFGTERKRFGDPERSGPPGDSAPRGAGRGERPRFGEGGFVKRTEGAFGKKRSFGDRDGGERSGGAPRPFPGEPGYGKPRGEGRSKREDGPRFGGEGGRDKGPRRFGGPGSKPGGGFKGPGRGPFKGRGGPGGGGRSSPRKPRGSW